jgi:hypothetical protein
VPVYGPKRHPALRWPELVRGGRAERGNLGLRCQRRSRKWKNHEGESTEAEPRGGTTRSSGEVPETGFTHMCGKTRKTGRFIVKRRTIRKRLSAKLRELKEELRRRWHQPVAEVGKWLKSVVQGYFNYHAVPGRQYG